MLLRKHAGALAACLRACPIVPSRALIPHPKRQMLVAWSCLCISDIASAGIFQSQLLRQKKPAVERDNKHVTVYLSKDMVPFPNVDRKGFKRLSKHWIQGTHYLPAQTSIKSTCQNYMARSASKWRRNQYYQTWVFFRDRSNLRRGFAFFSCSFPP